MQSGTAHVRRGASAHAAPPADPGHPAGGTGRQPLQIAHDIHLHAPQPGTRLRRTLGRQAKGDILVPLNAVVALGDLAFKHFHILAPDAVEVILLRRNIHFIAVGVPAAAVDKGKLER